MFAFLLISPNIPRLTTGGSCRYDSEPGYTCTGGANQAVEIWIGGQLHHTLERVTGQGWNLQWASYVGQFQAASTTTQIAFVAATAGCGCMLLDAVNIQEDCIPSDGPIGVPAHLCDGRVSTGRVVNNGCFADFPNTYNALNGSAHPCLTDGRITHCIQGGPDAVYTVALNCKGHVSGSVIINGGPDMPSGCGGFQESGTVIFSADGMHWTPAASWTCSNHMCNVDGEATSVQNGFGSAELTVQFVPDEEVQYIGVTLGSAQT